MLSQDKPSLELDGFFYYYYFYFISVESAKSVLGRNYFKIWKIMVLTDKKTLVKHLQSWFSRLIMERIVQMFIYWVQNCLTLSALSMSWFCHKSSTERQGCLYLCVSSHDEFFRESRGRWGCEFKLLCAGRIWEGLLGYFHGFKT